MIRNCLIKCTQQYRIIANSRQFSLSQQRWSSASNMNIFDRVAKQVQKDRAFQREDAKLFDYIKAEVGERMVDRMFDLTKECKITAEIGCGRGFITRHELPDGIEQFYLCDSSEVALKQAEAAAKPEGYKINTILMDEEAPKFDENSLDMVISNLSLHWVNDLPGCFRSIIKSLRPDGVFLASIFGGDTLFELRSSLQLAEMERKGGLSAHISPFAQVQDIGALLHQAGFKMLTIDTDELVIGYPSMFELMYDLKGMAENNASYNRPLHLSRDVITAAAAIYNELYKVENGVSATFQLIYLVGWKPGPNQPKPLERGSQNASFADLGKLTELSDDITKK